MREFSKIGQYLLRQLKMVELGAGANYYHENNMGYLSAVAIAEVHNLIVNDCANFNIQGLEYNSTLTSLGLNRNLIGEVNSEGAEAVGNMLKVNKTLNTLRLANNCLGSR